MTLSKFFKAIIPQPIKARLKSFLGIDELIVQIDRLIFQIDKLKKENQSLEKRSQSLEKTNQSLEKTNQSLEKKSQSLEKKNQSLIQEIIQEIKSLKVEKKRAEFPLFGHPDDSKNKIKFVDYLRDKKLSELNEILPWNCFCVDSHGRRFGNQANPHKRNIPQQIPDRRILLMDEHFNLSDKHVLEIGCFEGVHTIGLSMYAAKVTAFDSRIENVVKTIVRCAFFDVHPTVFQYDTEANGIDIDWITADVMHHVGVLYHLKNPVEHLLNLGKYIRLGIMLDTHYALDEEATESYEFNGKTYRYKHYQEGGYKEVFSGMYDHTKWLTLSDIMELLKASGFGDITILEKGDERNGKRVLMIAKADV